MSVPYFPLYVNDYEADTAHLTLAEDGAYVRLLRLCWRTPGCSIPDDDAWIRRKMRASQAEFDEVIMPVLDEFFVRRNGRVYSPRLVAEYEKVNATYRKRSKAGKMGGRPKAVENIEKEVKAGLSPAKAGPKQPEPEPEPYKTPKSPGGDFGDCDRFAEFWEAYPHRGGVKRKRKVAEQKFARAVKSGVSQQKIIDAAKALHSDEQVKRGYARDPATWLNQNGWDDEITPASKPADPKIAFFQDVIRRANG